jgi:hypothetical protein
MKSSRSAQLQSKARAILGLVRQTQVADMADEDFEAPIPTTEDQLLEQEGQMIVPDEPEA